MSVIVKVIKIKSRSLVTDCIAYMKDPSREWIDPWGGQFSHAEQQNFDEFLAGRLQTLTVGNRRYDDLFVTVSFPPSPNTLLVPAKDRQLAETD